MTDTTTAWTPEARRIREAERAGARRALEAAFPGSVERKVDELFPPPPPEYTYGREVWAGDTYRRRSDGVWEYSGCNGWRESLVMNDYVVRALAAEVPLTDKECDALTLGNWSGDTARRAFIRTAYARVLRGEVK